MPTDPLSQPAARRILAVVNQKGGVGKTTTAINLSSALAEMGRTVLTIDLDPQGNASTGLGVPPSEREASAYDLVMGGASVEDVVHDTDVEGLMLIPGIQDLSSADVEMAEDPRRGMRLADALGASPTAAGADHVIIDCPPSLNLLTVNAMAAADAVLVPLQCEFFAMEGLSQLLATVKEIRRALNPSLAIEGIVLTMFDRRNNLSHLVATDVRATLGHSVYRTIIPRNVRLSEAASFSQPCTVYDPSSAGSHAYRALARELLERSAASAGVTAA